MTLEFIAYALAVIHDAPSPLQAKLMVREEYATRQAMREAA